MSMRLTPLTRADGLRNLRCLGAMSHGGHVGPRSGGLWGTRRRVQRACGCDDAPNHEPVSHTGTDTASYGNAEADTASDGNAASDTTSDCDAEADGNATTHTNRHTNAAAHAHADG